MSTAAVRMPGDKRDTLKIIASVEKRDIKEILSELIDDYIERHRETLEILSRPDWVEAINRGMDGAEKGETVRLRKKNSAAGHLQTEERTAGCRDTGDTSTG